MATCTQIQKWPNVQAKTVMSKDEALNLAQEK